MSMRNVKTKKEDIEILNERLDILEDTEKIEIIHSKRYQNTLRVKNDEIN